MKKHLLGFGLLVSLVLFLFFFPVMGTIRTEQMSVIKTDRPLDPFFLRGESAEAVLVYFGYVGCTRICIPVLSEFAPVYEQLHKKHPSLPFYFVNLNPTQPREWVEPFSKSFHPNFHGIYATLEQVNELEKDFNLASLPAQEEMSHSSNLFLMIRENGAYVLKRIYITHPYDAAKIGDDIARYAR